METKIEGSLKRDGRTLDHKTLEQMRLIAAQRMSEGERPAAVAASFGSHRSWPFKCRAAVRGPGRGVKVLRSRQGTGRPRKLTLAQERQVFRWVNGKNPMQYGFDYGLWTRHIVQALVGSRFEVKLSLASVGALLARLDLTAQKPLQRAYPRDPEAIERWQRERYPAIVKRAKKDGADIYFWDESGFRADSVRGKTRGARGQTRWYRCPGSAKVSARPQQ